MTFESDVSKWRALTDEALAGVLQGVALKMTSRVILRTPVDTGRLRGNWQVGLNSRPQDLLTAPDKSGRGTTAKAQTTIGRAKARDRISIMNNLPYANPIEDGSSKQAPQGMVKVTVKEFRGIVDETVKEES